MARDRAEGGIVRHGMGGSNDPMIYEGECSGADSIRHSQSVP